MAKTRRRAAYRKTKRWNPSRKARRGRGRRRNPSARPGENDIETVRIRKGGRRNPRADFVRYLGDGSRVEVSSDGQVEVHDKGGLFSRYVVGRARLAHFLRDLKKPASRTDKYDFQGESLKGEGSYAINLNPGRKGRGHRGHKRKARGRSGTARGRVARALFRGKRRKGRSKARRNPRIKRSEAKAIGRVLKRHGYRCKAKRSSRRSRR